MMTPASYSYKASYLSSQQNYRYGSQSGKGSLSYDVEYAVLKVLQKQIEAAKGVEQLR
jgi:hypothetical protein